MGCVNNVMEGVMEERRRENDKNWKEIRKYIDESRTYRAAVEVQVTFVEVNFQCSVLRSC